MQRATDSNIFYDKGIQANLYRVQGLMRTALQVCEGMNIVMKHLSTMHFLLFCFCIFRILSRVFACVCVCTFSLLQIRLMACVCAVLYRWIRFAIYIHNFFVFKEPKSKSLTHVPCFCAVHSWIQLNRIICPFSQHATWFMLFFVAAQNAYTICI